jgi:hypothetical protein
MGTQTERGKSMKHTITMSIAIGADKEISILIDEQGLISMDEITDATVEEIQQLAELLQRTVKPRTQPTPVRHRKVVHGRRSPIGRHTTLRWNQKHRSNPVNLFHPNSLAHKVVKAVYPLTQKPITREKLVNEVAKKIKFPYIKVDYTLSHLIHTHKLLIVVE